MKLASVMEQIRGNQLALPDIQLPVIFLMVVAFLCAIFFNVWAFKNRDKAFKSVKQLLEDKN
jgi:hypothetical protein